MYLYTYALHYRVNYGEMYRTKFSGVMKIWCG